MPGWIAMKDQEQWIIEWLQLHTEASAVNEQFHEEFFQKFGGARSEKMWGAQPVHKAQRLLANLYNEGRVVRRRVSLGDLGLGFPNSVLVYSLK